MNARVTRSGERIAKVAGKNLLDAKREFVVFESKGLNAFALSGGKVGVYNGLIQFADGSRRVRPASLNRILAEGDGAKQTSGAKSGAKKKDRIFFANPADEKRISDLKALMPTVISI